MISSCRIQRRERLLGTVTVTPLIVASASPPTAKVGFAARW